MTRYDIAGKIYVFFTALTCSVYILALLSGNIKRNQLHISELEEKSATDIQALEEKYNSDVKALREDIDRLNQENADQDKLIAYQKDIIDTYDQKFDDLHKEVDAYTKVLEKEAPKFQLPTTWKGAKSTKQNGGVYGPSGQETYYNLPMNNCVANMRKRGYDAKRYPVWTRKDGAKMFGHYVMVAANWKIRPLGTVIETSIGWGIVVDTGEFVKTSPRGVDLAVNW